jgi:hypothetical protein
MSKHRHRLMILAGLLVSLISSIFSFPTAQAQDIQSQTFMGGGVNNLIVYPAANLTAAEAARNTASEILTKLAILFTGGYDPLGFESLVLLINEPGPNNAYAAAGLETAADAASYAGVSYTFSSSQVCVIEVYSAGIDSPAILPFNIAHETAHCLEVFYIAPTHADYELEDWWVEGIAEWAATLAYPDLAAAALAGVAANEAIFLAQNNHALTDTAGGGENYQGYGSYFFWLYLTSLGDTSTVINLLSRIPPTPSGEEDYQDFLAAEFDSAATMSHLGIVLAQEQIPFQVDRNVLFGDYQAVRLPETFSYAPNDFTLDFNGFEVEGSEDVKAVEISTTGLNDPAHAVVLAVDAGGVFTTVQDGAPVTICMQGQTLSVQTVLTRGDGDSAANFDLDFTPITDEDSPCTEPVNPGTPRTFPAWRAINVGAPAIPDSRVLFLDIDENTTIEVWNGPDLVYQRAGGAGPFTGTALLPPPYDSFEATLDILDATTRASTSIGTGGVMTYESSYQYLLTDEEYVLVTEINRRVLDYSMLSTCIGFDVTVPGRTWITPDPLIPLRLDNETGTLYLGNKGYTGSGFYTEITTEPTPTGSLETIFSIAITGDQVAYIRYESTLDGRADCRIVYESMLIPYNGDLATLFADTAAQE